MPLKSTPSSLIQFRSQQVVGLPGRCSWEFVTDTAGRRRARSTEGFSCGAPNPQNLGEKSMSHLGDRSEQGHRRSTVCVSPTGKDRQLCRFRSFFLAPRPFGLVTGSSLFSLWPGSFVPWSSFVACAALVGRCRCRSACGTGPSRQGILTTRACLIRAGGSGPPILRKIRKCAALDIIWA